MAKILLIGDMVGCGRLAVGAQMSVLQPMGHSVSNLPTALVSNNFCYKQYAILDTTEYMRESIAMWDRLGFVFDVISVGFIASDLQAELLYDFLCQQRAKGAYVLVDPIMADGGKFYSGLSEANVHRLKRLISLADLIVPNYTEACYLTQIPFSKEGLSESAAKTLLEALKAESKGSILVTSCQVLGKPHVIGYDAKTGHNLFLPYREVPVNFSGTGDIFTAMLLGKLLKGKSLPAATQITIEQLSALIDTNQDVENKFEGLPIS